MFFEVNTSHSMTFRVLVKSLESVGKYQFFRINFDRNSALKERAAARSDRLRVTPVCEPNVARVVMVCLSNKKFQIYGTWTSKWTTALMYYFFFLFLSPFWL
jgi:hypothetical protein